MIEPTVYIVDDDPDSRDTLRWLIEPVGLHVVTYPSADDFDRGCPVEGPSCLVLDVRMPGLGGGDLFDSLAARGLKIPVLFITARADVPMAIRAMKLGAAEFLEKPFNTQVLLETIQRALRNDTDRLAREATVLKLRSLLDLLNDKEREVLELTRQGRPDKEIATVLKISTRTVGNRRASVMQKLEVTSLPELLQVTVGLEEVVGKPHELSPTPRPNAPSRTA